jgi:hypothetical protein
VSEEVEDGDEHLPLPPFARGLVAVLPLFLFYEIGLASDPSAQHNGAELFLGLILRPLGEKAHLARWAVLIVAGLWALVRLRREGTAIGALFGRTLLEGLACALVLGPLLFALLSVFDLPELASDLSGRAPGAAPGLGRALRLVGAAPWEELLFRVGVYGILVLLTARAAHFLGASRTLSLLCGELAAIFGSSIAFAAFHLESVQQPLGGVGIPFDGAVFLWHLVAGLLLAGIFRWRGLGCAAWAHGLFNLGLALGAAPDVFL